MVACLLIKIDDRDKNGLHLCLDQSIHRIIEILILPEYPDCLCLHFQVEEKTPIWQMALNMESENIITGYGFGSTFLEAKSEAILTLSKRINDNECQMTVYGK
ncbi:hypothetical protein KQI76_10825 [Amphibacillus sp. MSJ-3]|uniref:hypothetical protein n=1 Tax=Amphibacillus sp. MSJ-3 TaxID=2841505 RepID=UPI001C0ED572|nr:hypothetical protein [Amphibacillus sp. MSJ-3]MBU5595630.1 hypothetical protein [Amphibacillus sp. MSJ-3]